MLSLPVNPAHLTNNADYTYIRPEEPNGYFSSIILVMLTVRIGIVSQSLYPCLMFALFGPVVLLHACPARCVLALFYPPATAPVSDLWGYICFCRKSVQLLRDGRNVIQLRGKAVLVRSQTLSPLSSVVLEWAMELPMRRSSLTFFESKTENGSTYFLELFKNNSTVLA